MGPEVPPQQKTYDNSPSSSSASAVVTTCCRRQQQPASQPASHMSGQVVGLTKASSPHPGSELSGLTQESERSQLKDIN